jgi:hypothetical protein
MGVELTPVRVELMAFRVDCCPTGEDPQYNPM